MSVHPFDGIFVSCVVLAALLVWSGTRDALYARAREDRVAGALMAMTAVFALVCAVLHVLRGRA